MEPVAPAFERVVVGEVLTVTKHPDADRLTCASVDAGRGTLQIVCGAPNVRAGMKRAAAHGRRAVAGHRRSSRQRCAASNRSGMLCSAKELGLRDDACRPADLAADAPVGTDMRDVSGARRSALHHQAHAQSRRLPERVRRGARGRGDHRRAACIAGCHASVRAYHRAIVLHVDARGTSSVPALLRAHRARRQRRAPRRRDWMVQRLERSGLRTISAIVDVTNYVMLELGSRCMRSISRASTAASACASAAAARRIDAAERAGDRRSKPDLLVIADERKPLALAGIMGGADSAVTRDDAGHPAGERFF